MSTLLFSNAMIFDVMNHQVERAKQEVSRMQPDTLLNSSEHDLIESIVETFELKVPTIDEANICISHTGEKRLDVSRDRNRMIFDRSQPFYMQGTEVAIAIPFEGDAECFRIRPSDLIP